MNSLARLHSIEGVKEGVREGVKEGVREGVKELSEMNVNAELGF